MPYKSPSQQRKSRSILKGIGCLSLALGLLAGISFLAFCGFYFFRASQFKIEEVSIMPERTVVLDKNGKELGKVHGENRTVVEINEISPFFLMSIVAREDARFFEHNGIDLRGLARATLRNIKDRRMTQGASTITMQLARNSFDLSQGKEWYHELDRKILEIFVALKIEQHYKKLEERKKIPDAKSQILEFYCNRIFWGHSMLGIESASQAYLDKPAKELTLSEGAMLAGIVRGPNAFSPFRSIKLATRERDTVLDRLVYYSFIQPEEGEKAKSEPLRIRPKKTRTRGQSYAMDAISRELTHYLSKNNIKVGGLTVHTTIDSELQKIAEDSINKRLQSIESLSGYKHQTRYAYQKSGSEKAPAYIQGALVCIDNKTGGIVATVGGRSADESRFNRAYYARRQIGSLFKPFVFQAAFDRGLRPQTLIDDSALRPGEIDYAQDNWNPGNSDEKFKGLIETREALLKSRNTSSVRVGDFAQMDHVQKAAEYAGFSLFQPAERARGKTPETATSYLGSWEASPEEVARAYTIFPNNGVYKRPFLISKIVERDGKEHPIGSAWLEDDRLSIGSTYEVTKILEDINIHGTGRSLRDTHGFTSPSAGKTGTTDDYKDAWYAGYTSALTCAVWVGLDTPKRTINKGYGSTLALPIWADLMKAASQRKEFSPKPLGKDIQTTKLLMCQRSARRANEACTAYESTYEDTIPNDLFHLVNKPCTIHTDASAAPITQESMPKPASQLPKSPVDKAVSGFFEKLFGGKKDSPPPRAIIVEEDSIYQDNPAPEEEPPRAIIIEDEPSSPTTPPSSPQPARAIIVEDPPSTPSLKRPIIVTPNRAPHPSAQPRKIQSPSPRKSPPKAIIVEDPIVTPPPKAIIVEEPPAEAPPRAIIID